MDFQRDLAAANTELPIIFITGHGDIPMTVQAMKGGAIEFLTKPFRDQDLLDAVNVGLARDRVGREQNESLSALRTRFEALTPRERKKGNVNAFGTTVDRETFESVCEDLSRRHLMVRRTVSDQSSSGMLSECYEFAHALYREVFYRRQSPARRAKVQLRIGGRATGALPFSA